MANSELKIEQKKDGGKLFCKLTGWLDPNTSPMLLEQVDVSEANSVIFDLADVEYVFSSGLRAFLVFQKMIEGKGGTMKLVNVPDQIRFVFTDTGLDELLEVKE